MIYVVDDDISVRRAFELFLESAELEYQSFESVSSFLSGANPTVNDLLVLDLCIPGMNGEDLLKKFNREGLVIPVIVVTAFDDPQSREYCKQYGVKAYMRKPVDGEALVDFIIYSLSL